MEPGRMAQIWALIALGAAVAATALQLTRGDAPQELPAVHLVASRLDSLRDDQRHCQQLGQAAAADAVCLRVWSETRDRFLGRTVVSGTPADPTARDGAE